MCLAPCYQGCTDERYAEEAAGVEQFFATRGDSRLVQLRPQRDEASANLEFEQAAAAHAQVLKAEAVRALASELVRPMSQLRAVDPAGFCTAWRSGSLSLQGWPAARAGCGFSTVGMRIQNEQSGSTSLFRPADGAGTGAGKQGTGSREQGTGRDGQGASCKGQRSCEGGAGNAGGAAGSGAGAAFLGGRDAGRDRAAGASCPAETLVLPAGSAAAGRNLFPRDEAVWPVRAILRAVGRVAAKSVGGAPAA